jgi:PPOX class probable F420-dependent enzyme
MTTLPTELGDLIKAGPLVHLSTINSDGSPQVSVIWVGIDGDQLVSGHMSRHLKLRNIERDPRVVLSFEAPRDRDAFLNPYAILRARATVEPSDQVWDLLNGLTKVYLSPAAEFPGPRRPGYLVRYTIERIGGVGPWAPHSALSAGCEYLPDTLVAHEVGQRQQDAARVRHPAGLGGPPAGVGWRASLTRLSMFLAVRNLRWLT